MADRPLRRPREPKSPVDDPKLGKRPVFDKPGFEPIQDPDKVIPGQVSGVLTVDDKTLFSAVRRAAFRNCFGSAKFNGDRACVWVRGNAELGIRPGKTALLKKVGQFDVRLELFSDQTKDFDVVVTLAVGSPKVPLGLMAATESLPVGLPRNLVQWSDSLMAFAWSAVHDALVELAAKGAPPFGKGAQVPITIEVGDLTSIRVGPQVPFRKEVAQ